MCCNNSALHYETESTSVQWILVIYTKKIHKQFTICSECHFKKILFFSLILVRLSLASFTTLLPDSDMQKLNY